MSRNLTTKHEGETTLYTSCICNCGSDSQCVFKAHVRDGMVVAVEPDDRYNTGVGSGEEQGPHVGSITLPGKDCKG